MKTTRSSQVKENIKVLKKVIKNMKKKPYFIIFKDADDGSMHVLLAPFIKENVAVCINDTKDLVKKLSKIKFKSERRENGRNI